MVSYEFHYVRYRGLMIDAALEIEAALAPSASHGGSPGSTEFYFDAVDVEDGDLFLLSMSEDGLLDEPMDIRFGEGLLEWEILTGDQKHDLIQVALSAWYDLICEEFGAS